ncbi:tautomerase family protein [Marinobacter sp. LQ44]|uniref:tautomerase family protein n=1 Tax=Marinobacter TaxID=2742 RepID=UPI000718FB4F|nr:4-oxalocrotonate tautomerase family protein [Marinobacter sp. LQ44]AMQ87674.1 tautomerase [Marinobacter sp. LQ44]
MPYVNIKVTREGVTESQKAALIEGVTNLLVDVLQKSPAATMVVIDEVDMENWGIGGLPVNEYRRRIANLDGDTKTTDQ